LGEDRQGEDLRVGEQGMAVVDSTRRVPIVWATVTLVLVALLSVSAYVALDAAQGAIQPCAGKDVYPSQNLTNVAQNASAGTTFCIHDGTYKISSPIIVQRRDVFVGLYDDGTRPVVTTITAFHIFYAGDDPTSAASGATIKGLTVSGAVGNNQCEPKCGRGIGGGKNLTVDNVRVTDNLNSGIGGTVPGLVVRNSIIDHNGSYSFSMLDGGSSSAAGIKSVNSMSVKNSYIHHNWWNGVWCDEECNALTVQNSKIVDNGKAGIADETSSGPALFTGNTIQRNGWNDAVTTRRAGLLINDADHAEAYGNTFGGNFRYGVEMADSQGRLPNVTDNSIHDNTMNGDLTVGCSISEVSCYRNN
jgi:hypothetical protein